MPLAPSLPCADLAGPNCPCALGLAGECVYCTRLRGQDICACQWVGACVLLADSGRSATVSRTSLPEPKTRLPRVGRVQARSEPVPGIVDLRVAVSPRLAPLLRRPGCYVFVRPSGFDESYNTPLTVVDAHGETMRLVLKVAGPKTQAIARVAEGANLIWKGPYSSGLLGMATLRRAVRKGPGVAAIVARGMGQIVALPVVRLLKAKGWAVLACIDPRGSGGDFARAELESALGGKAVEFHSHSTGGAATVLAAMSRASEGRGAGPRLLVSCGTDPLHRWVGRLWRSLAPQDGAWGLVATNNTLAACGEGTCGACTLRMGDGARIRACKADVPPELLFAADGNTNNRRSRQ